MTCLASKSRRTALVCWGGLTIIALGVGIALIAPGAVAWAAPKHEEGGKGKASESEETPPPEAEAPQRSPAEQYCESVQEAAVAARSSLQKKELDKMQSALEERIKVLDEKTAEIKAWLQRREDFLKQANESLTAIYSKMPPEAAAARLLLMNEMTAAAILSKLSPKGASAILAEIESVKAARLSSLLAGVAEIVTKPNLRDKE